MARTLKHDADKRMGWVVTNANPEGFPDADLAKLDRDRLPAWIEELKQAEAATRLLRYRLEDLLREQERRCHACGGPVTGRRDRVYCGATCRKRANRGQVLPEFSPYT